MARQLAALIAGAIVLASVAADAQSAAATYGTLTHAAFFSLESKQANLLDPQVFVADPSAAAGTGPQGIVHAAGRRPAFGVDDPMTPLLAAQGKALGFSLGQWFAARGSITLTTAGTGTQVDAAFTALVPGGRYSLFENHFSPAGVTFTPLDGTGTSNSFSAAADGSATLRVTAPGRITHAEGILLVFHSDGRDHGTERGELGVTSHHQLIVRIP